jgi:hypothetical protein
MFRYFIESPSKLDDEVCMSLPMLEKLCRRAAPLLLITLLLGGCKDDPIQATPEPTFATMRLTIGTQVINIANPGGAVTGGPILLQRNVSTPVTATFLLANGQPDPIVVASSFELRITPVSGGVTFARTGTFAGTLTAPTAGPAAATFTLYHTGAGHAEFESLNTPITVQ